MSSSIPATQPEHRTHNEEDPLPSKAPFDYSAKNMESARLPASELGGAPGSKAQGGNCGCHGAKEGHHEDHCHSSLHKKQPLAHQPPVHAPEGHHFFNEENPRPRPVSSEERETVEWLGKQAKED